MNIQPESSLPVDNPSSLPCIESISNERPQILALAHSTNLAGAQLALASLVKNTNEQLDWTVVCPNDGPFVEKIESHAMPIVVEQYPWWCQGDNYDRGPADFDVAELNNVLDSVDYDYSLTNTITVPWLAYNARERDKPHIWYVHEYGDLDHNLSFALGYDNSINYMRQVSDVVLTVSQSVGEHLLEHGASSDNLKYISQSFDVDAYLEVEPPTDQKELLILGSIKESKGQLDALVGYSESAIQDSHRLSIAGPVTDSRYASTIEQYISAHNLQDKVTFTPRRVDAIEQMKQASTALVCSKNEALGRITLEALAAGRTVVGRRGGGTETLLADGMGILYDGSVADLAQKLDQLEEASDTTLQPVEVRRQHIIDTFSPANERNDFLDAIAFAEQHHAEQLRQQLGKTGIFNAMRAAAIIV